MDKGKVNTIIFTINEIFEENESLIKRDFLCDMGIILCEFDTDIAIAVLEEFGDEGKEEALAIKVNYGY